MFVIDNHVRVRVLVPVLVGALASLLVPREHAGARLDPEEPVGVERLDLERFPSGGADPTQEFHGLCCGVGT